MEQFDGTGLLLVRSIDKSSIVELKDILKSQGAEVSSAIMERRGNDFNLDPASSDQNSWKLMLALAPVIIKPLIEWLVEKIKSRFSEENNKPILEIQINKSSIKIHTVEDIEAIRVLLESYVNSIK